MPWRIFGTDATASDDEVMAAAKSAQVEEFINRLPDGYQTFLVNAAPLVRRQRQRIGYRAGDFRKNAPLLLLDEATAHWMRNPKSWCKKA